MLKKFAWKVTGWFFHKNKKNNTSLCDFGKAKKVAVVFNGSEGEEVLKAVEKLVSTLQSAQKKVTALGYYSKELNSISAAYFDWFSDGDLSFKGKPTHQNLKTFCNHYFDIVYLVNFDKFYEGHVLLRNCNFGCLIAIWNEDSIIGDLIIKLKPHSPQAINQLFEYSKILSTDAR